MSLWFIDVRGMIFVYKKFVFSRLFLILMFCLLCLRCLYFSIFLRPDLADIVLLVITFQFSTIGAIYHAGNIFARNTCKYANYLSFAVFYGGGSYNLIS